MKFDRPLCAQNLEISDEWAGYEASCPVCNQTVIAPEMVINKKGQAEQNLQGFSIYGGSYYGTKALKIDQSSYWVKLERVGKILAGYLSQDGTNWAATDVGQGPRTLNN